MPIVRSEPLHSSGTTDSVEHFAEDRISKGVLVYSVKERSGLKFTWDRYPLLLNRLLPLSQSPCTLHSGNLWARSGESGFCFPLTPTMNRVALRRAEAQSFGMSPLIN